ncbi:MAG: alpha/beta fold hydrolase [Acidimicrobiales bacterium]
MTTVLLGCLEPLSGMVLAVLTSFDGGRLFGQVHGSGRPVVIALHGWRRDHRDFDLVLGGGGPSPRCANPAVAGDFEPEVSRDGSDVALPESELPSIALDLPGFGGTPPPDSAWGSEDYARAVIPVIEALGARVAILAHSFGGRVAVHIAAQHPEMVSGLVLTGTPLFPATSTLDSRVARTRPPMRYRMVRELAKRGIIGEDRLEELRQRYGSADYRAAIGVMRDVLVRAITEEREEAYTPALKLLKCPVELVWGEVDSAAPPLVARRITEALSSKANLEVLPGIGHLTPLLVPGHLRAAIDRLESSGGRSQ